MLTFLIPHFFCFKIIGNSVCFPACRSRFPFVFYVLVLPCPVTIYYPRTCILSIHLYTTTSVAIPQSLGYVVVLLLNYLPHIRSTQLIFCSLVTQVTSNFVAALHYYHFYLASQIQLD